MLEYQLLILITQLFIMSVKYLNLLSLQISVVITLLEIYKSDSLFSNQL